MSEEWRAVGRDMFASFPEVVATAQVVIQLPGEPVYDRESGKMVRPTKTLTVPVIEQNVKSKLVNQDLWQEGDYTVIVGTFDITDVIPAGSLMSYVTVTTGVFRSNRIIQTAEDDMGAYAYLYAQLRGTS